MISFKRKLFDARDVYNLDRSIHSIDKYRIMKQQMIQMVGNRCPYCQRIFSSNNQFSVEHIIARSIRPDLVNDDGNLTVACTICNQYRGNKYNVGCVSELSLIMNNVEVASDGHLLVKSDYQNKVLAELLIRAYGLNDQKLKESRATFKKILEYNQIYRLLLKLILEDNDLDNEEIKFPAMLCQQSNVSCEEKQAILVMDRYYNRNQYLLN